MNEDSKRIRVLAVDDHPILRQGFRVSGQVSDCHNAFDNRAMASVKSTRFNIKVEIGGLAGLLAPLLGKQPKDASVWIIGGEAPGFVRSESQFYQGGPLWRIELASPDYPRPAASP